MVATLAADLHAEVGELTGNFGGNPIAVKTFGNVVFGFTCNDAVHATNALFCINDHCESSHDYAALSMVTKLMFIAVPPINGSMAYLVINWESLAPRPLAYFISLAV